MQQPNIVNRFYEKKLHREYLIKNHILTKKARPNIINLLIVKGF